MYNGSSVSANVSAQIRERAVKRHISKRNFSIAVAGLVSLAGAAFMLMFALALYGHPQFGFLELWLAAEAVSTVITIGVATGLNLFAAADKE